MNSKFITSCHVFKGFILTPSQSTLMYFKLYAKRIDKLHMPMGYQPLKFQSFNEKGNLK